MDITDIEKIQRSGKLLFVAATGAGTSYIGEFLKIPGGSSVIMGGNIPYNQKMFNAFAGVPAQYTSTEASRKLAVAAFKAVADVFPDELGKIVGVGIAGALEKKDERPNRNHNVYITTHTKTTTREIHISLTQGLSRTREESLVCDIINKLLLDTVLDNVPHEPEYKSLLQNIGVPSAVYLSWANSLPPLQITSNDDTLAVYPGSFNPLHVGHVEIYNMSKEFLNRPVYFELTRTNSYKPAIDYLTLAHRVFNIAYPVLVTEAPRMRDKCEYIHQQYPNIKNIIFVVGGDIWNKIFDAESIAANDIEYFMANNVKFLVFGREKLNITDHPLMIRIPEALNYKNSISSTEMRKKINYVG